MRKTVLYIAMSLDGYIADHEGKVDFLTGHHTEYEGDYGYEKWFSSVDTIIMGMRTYRQIATELSPGRWPYQGKRCYIFSRRSHPDDENVEFVQNKLIERVSEWKQEQGKDIWICGGAQIAAQLIESDMIDEYQISVIPVILGEGIPLFPHKGVTRLLKLEKTAAENGVVHLIYTRRQEPSIDRK